jgi:RHS repeat-associated protein
MASMALILAALNATPAQSQSLADYRCTYNATVSSGHGNITGGSEAEVCAAIVGASFPRLVNGAEYKAEGTHIGEVVVTLQPEYRTWWCRVNRTTTRLSDGAILRSETGIINMEGVTARCSPIITISLSGPGSTKALPAGPALPLVATVIQAGAPAVGKAVSISVAGGGTVYSGTTNAAGQYHFTYQPPQYKATNAQLSATCGGCSNTATHSINVSAAEAPQSCSAGAGAGSGAGGDFGNPVSPATAEKRQQESDYSDAGAHPLHWVRHYRSRGNLAVGLGEGWAHAYAAGITGASNERTVQLGDGTRVNFSRISSAAPWLADNATDGLSETAQGWHYTRASDESKWQLDATGTRLLSMTQRNGWTLALAYNAAGQLATVTNAFGRSLTLAYNAQGQLTSATTPDGRTISYAYTSDGRLSSATQPDATSRTYLYDNPAWPSGLSGIVDETGQRIATYSYDSLGRATGTSQAGGAQNYSVSYPAPDPQAPNGSVNAGTTVDPAIYRLSVQVTDPLGNPQSWTYQGGDGNIRVLGANGAYMGGQVASRSFTGATTLAQSETDFLGITTLFTWDTARRLKVAETKAASRPEAQSTQTEWHPTFRLPVLVTEAGRTTAYTYDALGNKLSETQTDTATGQARTWAWTYNTQGLDETHTDASGEVWTYTWDSQGNRTRVRDPLGYETAYTFDAAGRVLTQTGPNRAPLVWTYDARGRVISQTSGADNVAYSYTPAGQIAGMVQSDGLQVSYQYDAAQRLTGASDNRGNSVQYTLDAMGNRTREEVRDATGAIALVTARVINNLNKVAAIQGASGQTTQLGYDANGELTSQTDPLNQTTRQTLDGLRRSTATTFADNTAATQGWNALDQLTQLTDPKGVATQYTYNAFGEVLTETSPDIGTIRYTRDAAGRVTSTEDARGQITQITRDALGRPTEIRYATDHVVSNQYNGAGDITRIDDKSGATAYEHDNQGRITLKTQDVNDNPGNPARFITAYSYTNGRLSSITYPSGFKVSYSRSAGRITGISVQAPGRNKPVQPFVTDLTHTALGQPKSWSWSNGDSANRTFDTDGRMTGNEFASYIYDAASRITGITQHLWASSTATGTVTTYTTPLSWSVGYDSRNRLISFNRPGAETSYTYDANSNRLTAIDKTTSDTDLDGDFDGADFQKTTSQNLTIEGTSNRLLGFTQTLTNVRGTRTVSTANTNVSYAVDAAGNLTSDGLRTFEYDAANRISKARIFKDGEEASIRYLHNALGQRVFKGEPTASQTLPSETDLGTSFIDWLRKNFKWLYANAQANTSIGTAYVYGDREIPSWALLGEYDNGSAKGAGRSEFIWLPTDDGSAIPVGMFRNGKLFAIHSDHLGTPRLMTNDQSQPVWQWPYSAFGNNKPTGVLKAAPNPKVALTNIPVLLKATAATEMNLRFPGQEEDLELAMRQNFHRIFRQSEGRYTQNDPIGLEGGLNRFGYVEGDPLTYIDPEGLLGGRGPGGGARKPPPVVSGFGCMGIACASGSTQDSGAQFSAELSFGGGIEICDAPQPPKPEPETCPRNQGNMYGDGAKPQPQFPGLSVPKRFGGAFIGPSMKTDGRVCVRIGPHVSFPFPSLDLGGLRR